MHSIGEAGALGRNLTGWSFQSSDDTPFHYGQRRLNELVVAQ